MTSPTPTVGASPSPSRNESKEAQNRLRDLRGKHAVVADSIEKNQNILASLAEEILVSERVLLALRKQG